MKKLLLTLSFLYSIALYSQVGIGTNNPDQSSLLDISSSDTGVLIPRVELLALNNPTPIVNPSNSLLVFNTNTSGVDPFDVVPGYYYWNSLQNSWNRLLNDQDLSSSAPTLLPWLIQGTTDMSYSNTDNIYQMGNVAIGTDLLTNNKFEIVDSNRNFTIGGLNSLTYRNISNSILPSKSTGATPSSTSINSDLLTIKGGIELNEGKVFTNLSKEGILMGIGDRSELKNYLFIQHLGGNQIDNSYYDLDFLWSDRDSRNMFFYNISNSETQPNSPSFKIKFGDYTEAMYNRAIIRQTSPYIYFNAQKELLLEAELLTLNSLKPVKFEAYPYPDGSSDTALMANKVGKQNLPYYKYYFPTTTPTSGQVLTAVDNDGNLEWRTLPATSARISNTNTQGNLILTFNETEVDITKEYVTIDLYEKYYLNQYNNTNTVKSNVKAILRQFNRSDFDYFVTAFNANQIENINLSENGVLTFKVKNSLGMNVTRFNVILQTK